MRLTALLAVVLAVVPACGDGSTDGRTTLTVLAASSLTDAFDGIAPAFEDAHPGVDLVVSFGGSSALAAQIDAGGPGDVVVAADERTLLPLAAAGLVDDPVAVARNRLAIAVEKGNPESIRGLADLARPGLAVVLCAPAVPCGRYAALALAGAGVDVEARSLEENVRAVVSKVALGEADAGIVYTTDVRAARADVDGVTIEGAGDAALLATYQASAVVDAEERDTDERAAAAEFVEFLTSAEGQRILAAAGFLPRA